jgi:glycosyltransferase involved in cell wall biosynthesis
LASLDYEQDQFEVIVVDDGSREPMESVVDEFKTKLNLVCLPQENTGPAGARNFGARQARGDMLAFLDDDCAPMPDWLREMDAEAHRCPDAMMGGTTINGCPENIFATTNQLLLEAAVAWLNKTNSALRFFPSNNLAVPASAFRAISGFDDSMPLVAGEDREFCSRWVASGKALALAGGARIHHYHPQTLRSFLSMHFRYGRGAALLHHRRHSKPLQSAEMGLYTALLRAGWRAPAGSRLAITVLLVLSQAAAGLGYFVAASKSPGVRQSSSRESART